MRGYYSLIQYCPDATRGEAANVGVILLCPECHFVDSKIASGNDRPRRFFNVAGDALQRLEEMKAQFGRRLKHDSGRIYKVEEFEHFVATRANKLLITPPRNMRVDDPETDLARLFNELVGGRALGEPVQRNGRGVSVRANLREMFLRPDLSTKVKAQVPVAPKYGRPFNANYAFYNGKSSFVLPQTIHLNEELTYKEAEVLAFRGGQLAKYGTGGKNAELIVPLPDSKGRFASTIEGITNLLRDNSVRTFYESELEDLAEEIRTYAYVV